MPCSCPVGTFGRFGGIYSTSPKDRPNVFFHLVDSHRRVDDYKGSEFDNLDAAKRAAETVARDFLVEELLDDHDPDGRRYEITNADGRLMSTIRFKDVLPPALKR